MATFVQFAKVLGSDPPPVNPTVTAGNGLIILLVASNADLSQQITGVVDALGNSYSRAIHIVIEPTFISGVPTGNLMIIEIWYCTASIASGLLTFNAIGVGVPQLELTQFTGYFYEVQGAISLNSASSRAGSGIPGLVFPIQSSTLIPTSLEEFVVTTAAQVDIFAIPSISSPWVKAPQNLTSDQGPVAYAITSSSISAQWNYGVAWDATTTNDWITAIASFGVGRACPSPAPPGGNPAITGCE